MRDTNSQRFCTLLGGNEVTLWLVALVLFAPVVLTYGLQIIAPWVAGLHPTGFLQYDQPTYMANAREHFDQGFTWLYSLPFHWDTDSPRLYFQPQTLLLGFIYQHTGLPAGVIYVSFGALCGIACMRAAIALYQQVIGLETTEKWLGMLCFAWGGGVLMLAGFLLASDFTLDWRVLTFDPGKGMWFLNFGRNLIFPTEAYYHLLSFSILLMCMRRHYLWALAFLALLSLSHPITGIQILLVVFTWSLAESVLFKRTMPRWWFSAIVLLMILLHLGYYLWWLGHFPEHEALHAQWLLDWFLSWQSALLAYGLVAALVLSRIFITGFTKPWSNANDRLLLVCFVVSLALANHELFMGPVQPLHFTRGYVWIPLFLLGAPVLVRLFHRLLNARGGSQGRFSAMILIGILLTDNVVWFTWWTGTNLAKPGNGYEALTTEETGVIRQLRREELKNHLVISRNTNIAMFSNVETPLRTWVSHAFNTPGFAQRKAELSSFYVSGQEPSQWHTLNIAVVVDRTGASARTVERLNSDPEFHKIQVNNRFNLYLRPALVDTP